MNLCGQRTEYAAVANDNHRLTMMGGYNLTKYAGDPAVKYTPGFASRPTRFVVIQVVERKKDLRSGGLHFRDCSPLEVAKMPLSQILDD